MEPSKEPISVRVAKLNTQLVSSKNVESKSSTVINREGLLDALTALYDECNTDYLKKCDQHILSFVDKHRSVLHEVKCLRVNISDFEVKNVIGRGYFSKVNVVKEKQTGDVYAMKTIKKSDCVSQKYASFEEERNIMACNRSPWLTSLQYAFQDSFNLYFIMEYHPGGDLCGLLHRQDGTIPESAATFYIAQLVLALNDLHTMGYVHRDVKPENILLDRCGHIKLADFGSAAKLNSRGFVNQAIPVGTPDYIAPEVLQSNDNKSNKKTNYGKSCDYWSVGVLAYRLTVGNAPFNGSNTTETYSKIMNHKVYLRFPSELVLTQAYTSLVKGLITEPNARLNYEQILKHPLFKNVDFSGLRDQVPPYVPKIDSVDDTSNFHDIPANKNEPNIENFKTKTQFSGRNLPFIGFTYTNDIHEFKPLQSHNVIKDERLEELQKELNKLQKQLVKSRDSLQDKENLERKLEDKTRKLDSIESVRNNLERDLANSIAECGALRRTLELERKDRTDLERKALELIKSAKLKWENSEKTKVDALNLELAQQNEKIEQLTATNSMLNDQLQHAFQLENKHKSSIENVQKLNRQSIVGLESRLEKITSESQEMVSEYQKKIAEEQSQRRILQTEITKLQTQETILQQELAETNKNCKGLTMKLEANQKLIKELENKIHSLEGSMKDASEKNKRIYLDKEETFRVRASEKEKELDRELKDAKNKCADLNEKIQVLENQVKTSIANREASFEKERAEFNTRLQTLEQQLTKSIEEKNNLDLKLEESKTNELSNKLKVQTLEDLLKRLESGVSKLESDCEKENVLKEQVERLEKQLIEVHENAAIEKQELSQLKSKFWRMEKDLSNAEIDKRIFKRELKETEEQNKQLMAQVGELKTQMTENAKMHEAALLELNDLNENLANEIIKLKEVTIYLESKIESEKEKCDNEKSVIDQLKAEIEAKKSSIASILKDLEVCRQEKHELNRKLEIYQNERCQLLSVVEASNNEKNSIKNELDRSKQVLQNTQQNLIALRESCSLLENQLIEYENIHASYETKQQSLNTNTEKLVSELTQAKEEIQKTKQSVNEERSLKLAAETKCKRLIEDVECLKNECSSYKQQCIEFRQYSANLTDELTAAEEKIVNYEVTIKSYERQISELMEDNRNLKEENSKQLTHLSEVKSSNYQLEQQIIELKRDNTDLIQALGELQDMLTQKANFYKERELKADGTIQQQIKLIDFLQSKVEDSKKKKTLSDKIFGHSKKENQGPVMMNYKDLENLLYKERDANKELRLEINKLRSELGLKGNRDNRNHSEVLINATMSPRTKLAMEKLAQSPNTQKSDLYRQNSTQRMYHNIPHRFESKLCTKFTKCAHCSNQVILGRNMKYCTECHVHVHPYCAKSLPKTCGVPQALVKHYSDNLSKLSSSENVKKVPENGGGDNKPPENVNIEGWVKIPVRNSWERHYACLTPTSLKVYAQPPNNGSDSTVVESLELHPPNSTGMVIMEPVVSEIDIPVASSDLPFIIKVQVTPKPSCWPPKSITLMTLSIQDKEKWFKALQAVFQSNNHKYTGELVMKHEKDLHINCVIDLDEDTKILGTEQGLYSYHNNTLVRIAGLLSVHQIAVLKPIKLVVMIVDSSRYLITCNLDHLVSLSQCAACSKPTLIFKSVNVNNLEGFHLFQVSDFIKHSILCVATSKQLIIMSYEYNLYEFVMLRILDTAEPTSCMLFTEHSLIVGANKFFEIDLMSFEADEFLDISDKKLGQAILCYNVGSFPLAIMQVGKDPIEYLLCFHEFAIFVDEYGRCSRVTDIKWNRLPRAFYFHSPYLYVVQFSSVEIVKIISDTCNMMKNSVDSLVNLESFKVDLNNPRYLGHSRKGIYIGTGEEVRYIEGKQLDVESVSITSEETSSTAPSGDNEDVLDEFSFTSSMVRSLDGELSDDETECGESQLEELNRKQRKVHFVATETEF